MAENNGVVSGGFSLIKIESKAIEKLIDVVSSGIGTIYKPRAMRKEADAKAYEIAVLAEAEKKASIIKAISDQEIADLADRAKQRFIHQEVKRQLNVENVAAEAEKNLSDNVSDKPIDEDWKVKFFNKAQDVSSEDLQKVWGKILANEVNEPGTVSLRTLDLLSNLSKNEALLFSKFCSVCMVSGQAIKINGSDFEKYGISYYDINILREAGLVNQSDRLKISVPPQIINTDKPRKAFNIRFSKRGMIVSKENVLRYEFEIMQLTNSGLELLNVIYLNTSDEYFEDLKDYLLRKKYHVEETRLFLKFIGDKDVQGQNLKS